jgi:predicted house-cleaning noncanonical NTP pyrophosphatase (MazG superfamily)
LDANKLEEEIQKLMEDEEVEKKAGIYEYVLSGKTKQDSKILNLRTFSTSQKSTAYAKQKGICPVCHAQGIDKK